MEAPRTPKSDPNALVAAGHKVTVGRSVGEAMAGIGGMIPAPKFQERKAGDRYKSKWSSAPSSATSSARHQWRRAVRTASTTGPARPSGPARRHMVWFLHCRRCQTVSNRGKEGRPQNSVYASQVPCRQEALSRVSVRHDSKNRFRLGSNPMTKPISRATWAKQQHLCHRPGCREVGTETQECIGGSDRKQ